LCFLPVNFVDDSKLSQWLALWMLVIFIIALVRSRQNGVTCGLILAYVFDLWLIHWAAPSFYLLPWYHGGDPRLVEAGLEQSFYGIAAFAFSSLFLAPFLMSIGLVPRRSVEIHEPDRKLPTAYLVVGVVFYLLMSTAVGSLPTANAIIATGQELIVVGVGLCCWQAWQAGEKRKLALWIGAAFAFPLITIISRGFIGYGASALVCVLIFVSSFVRSKLKMAVGGALLVYLGLSVFVGYMRDRGEIRKSVWGGESLSNRADQLMATASNLEWFDPTNVKHLELLDGRLNQDVLLGSAVTRMEEVGGYAHGETIWESVLALIPRVLWPDKPMQAGSGDLVSRYTGIQFAAGTSIGIGVVMEFYVNFGTWGVIAGFLVMGALVTLVDLTAAECLAKGDLHGFVLWYLPGISLLQVGGSLMEVTTSAGASLAVAFIANKYLERLQNKQAALSALDEVAAGEWSDQSASVN
jgi:hypothetical protein